MGNNLCQFMLVILGALTIYLITSGGKLIRWGCIAGLLSEPFWFYTAIQNRQWGMVLLIIWYTIMFVRGIYKFRSPING